MSDPNLDKFVALIDQAQFTKAIELSGSLLPAHQNNPVFLQNLAKAHLHCGNPEQAKQSALQVQAIQNDFHAAQLLGDIYFKSGEFASALAALEKHEEAFSSQQTLNLMGAASIKLGQPRKAMNYFLAALALEPDFIEARCNLGTLYLEQGEIENCIECYERVIDTDPHHAQAYLNLGIAHQRMANAVESANNFRRAFTEDHELADALLYYSQVSNWKGDDALVHKMTQLLSSTDRPAAWRARISLALANAQFARNEKEKGFQFLKQGNALRKLELPYKIESDQQNFSTLVSRFKSLDLERFGTQNNVGNRTPVFIVGMPRSGTSLLEQILDAHSEVHGCGELSFLKNAVMAAEAAGLGVSRQAFQEIRSRYLAQTDGLVFDESFFTDKMPLNFRWIGYIAYALPEAKIVHIKRQAPATCWSVYKTFFAGTGNRFANDMYDTAHYYDLYSQLMAFWNEIFPGRILEVDYDQLTANFEESVRALLQMLGLEFEPSCLEYHNSARAVATASALQVHKKLYQGSSESWKTFSDQLQPMLATLEHAGHYQSQD